MSDGNSDAVNGSRFGFGGALPAGEATGSAVGWAIGGTSSGTSDTRPLGYRQTAAHGVRQLVEGTSTRRPVRRYWFTQGALLKCLGTLLFWVAACKRTLKPVPVAIESRRHSGTGGMGMDKTFDVDQFIADIGTDLVAAFEKARTATSPSAVGEAMEVPVKDKLEQLLPRGIGVGSGFVIDTNGATSRQTDVVLYERDLCPVFSINNTPGTTYYPCEGVIAVGQVKSLLTKRLLEQEFRKIASVKKLQRYAVHDFMPHPKTGNPIVLERSYGSSQNPSITDITERRETETRQIFGFIIAGSVQMSTNTLMETYLKFTRETGDGLSPNVLVVLTGGLLTWGNHTTKRTEKIKSDDAGNFGLRETYDGPARWSPSWSAQKAGFLSYEEDKEPFRFLIRWVYEIFRTGKTSDIRACDRYLLKGADSTGGDRKVKPKG